MSRTHRRKDVVAAVLIIGTAILYWTRGGRPAIVVPEGDQRSRAVTGDRPGRVSELPGIGTDAD